MSPSTDTHACTGTGQAFGKCLMDDNAVSRQALTTERTTSRAAVSGTVTLPGVLECLCPSVSQPSETSSSSSSSSSPLLHTQSDRPTDSIYDKRYIIDSQTWPLASRKDRRASPPPSLPPSSLSLRCSPQTPGPNGARSRP